MRPSLCLARIAAASLVLPLAGCEPSAPISAPRAEVAAPDAAPAPANAEKPRAPSIAGSPKSGLAAGSSILELGEDALRDLRLTTRKTEKRPAGDTIVVPGSLEADPDRVAAVSTPIPARISRIMKNVGEKVAAGEEVVALDSLDLGRARATVAAATARVEVSRSRSKLAQEQRDRIRSLASDRMATVRDVQAAEAEAAARAADLAESDVARRDAERVLALLPGDPSGEGAGFVLRAASAGTVMARDGVPGESVEAGHVFLEIADLSVLQALVHPFERDGVRVGASASVRLSAASHPAKIFLATFLRAGPEVDRESRTLPVRLAVRNAEGELLPGMSVTAEIRLMEPTAGEVVAVPIAAVQRVDRDWCVFLPIGKGRFERRAIARGRDLGGEVEILSGLAPGEEIVVEGAFVLRSESVRGADQGDEHEH